MSHKTLPYNNKTYHRAKIKMQTQRYSSVVLKDIHLPWL